MSSTALGFEFLLSRPDVSDHLTAHADPALMLKEGAIRKHIRLVMWQYVDQNQPWGVVSAKLKGLAICAVIDNISMLRKRGYTLNLVQGAGSDKGKPIPISHPDERKYVSWVSTQIRFQQMIFHYACLVLTLLIA